jgi:hypothetical protein
VTGSLNKHRGAWPAPTKKAGHIRGYSQRAATGYLHYSFLYLFIYPDKVDFSNRRHILIDKAYTKGDKDEKKVIKNSRHHHFACSVDMPRVRLHTRASRTAAARKNYHHETAETASECRVGGRPLGLAA